MAKAYLDNTKRAGVHPRDLENLDLDPLIDSIKKNGWVDYDPILITGDELGDNKIIYDGVRRMAALVEIGETVKVPVRFVVNIAESAQQRSFTWLSMARSSPILNQPIMSACLSR